MKRLSAAALAALVFLSAAAAGAEPAVLPEFSLPDQDGKVRTRAEFADRKALLVVFTGTQCPQCNRYLPALEALRAEYAARGVAVIAVNSNRNEQGEIAGHAREHRTAWPVLADADQVLADALAIEITPTVLVTDASGTIRYRGRFDRTWMGAEATGEDARKALDAVLEGRDVATPLTETRGCTVRRHAPKTEGDVTWAKDVAPIVFENCVQCHRPGQLGPMSLTDFNHASAFAMEIRDAVVNHRMPPWKPVGGQPMKGERKLTAAQVETIRVWADSGTPEGDPAQVPPLPEFSSDWLLGPPDMVLDSGEDFEVRAGPDLYWHFLMPNAWDEDKWVSAVEIRPGNARIVHHVLAYVDTMGIAKRLDAEDERHGYQGDGAWPGFVPTHEMGGWTPGFFALPLPDGVARKLPKKSTLVLQIHYNNATGSAQKDRTQIGLHFAKKPVRQQLYQARILNPWFQIPAGAEAHEISASWPTHRNITVISVMPHCHLLGKQVRMTAEKDNGKVVSLVEIDDWDFKWQDTYHFEKPLRLGDGTRVHISIVYDNSEKNPRNPFSPPRKIGWGEATTDEMCLGYVNYVRDHEDLTKARKKK